MIINGLENLYVVVFGFTHDVIHKYMRTMDVYLNKNKMNGSQNE